MAGIKRKDADNPSLQGSNIHKKPRKEERLTEKSSKLQVEETATDSDPIVESDTTSQSGENDGGSWPSGTDEDGGESGGVKVDEKGSKVKVVAGTPTNAVSKSAAFKPAATGISILSNLG